MELSIVSPIYRGEKMLDELVLRIKNAVETITDDYEIILSNDCSPDNSWMEIERICSKDKKVKGLNLSRNFGQPYAVTAGLSYATGKWVVVMDCDLQDRPEEIPNLYRKAREGWDVVLARRVERQDGFLKRMSSITFHRVYDWLSGMKTDKAVGNFGIYCKRIIEEYVKIPEYARSFSVLVGTLGFKTTYIEVVHAERAEGKSSYNLKKLLALSFNIIISNSNKPLQLAVAGGFVMSLVSLLVAFYNVFAKLFGLIDVPGFTFTIFSIWFMGGLLMSLLGILGLYIGKIFDQVKGRPIFVVRNTLNFDEKEY